MQINPASLLLLKKISAKKRAAEERSSVAVDHIDSSSSSETKSHKQRFQDWLSPKPETIQTFPGEKEIFRRGLILVTDTRLVFIDPFERMLKTYMFEHMISVHKQFYQTTTFNRLLCKGLLILSVLVFFIILTVDFLDSSSRGFFLAYIPLFASILIGLKVWNDMKPSYVVHWRMSDNTYEEIRQEPLLSERIKGDTKRAEFMNDFANAINQALSAKAWCQPGTPGKNDEGSSSEDSDQQSANTSKSAKSDQPTSPKLELVTDSYQQ